MLPFIISVIEQSNSEIAELSCTAHTGKGNYQDMTDISHGVEFYAFTKAKAMPREIIKFFGKART
jgi:hypothetical protein